MIMKLLKWSAMVAMAVLATGGFSACDDDNDNPNPIQPGAGDELTFNVSDVFEKGAPKGIGDMNIQTDSEGRVTGMVNNTSGETVKFVRLDKNSDLARDFDLIMLIKEGNETEELRLRLNKSGYVEYCQEKDVDGDMDEWSFEYNSHGQMSKMTRTEGAKEVYEIKYDGNRNITEVVVTSDELHEGGTNVIDYGAAPIANLGNLMLFDECFGIDLDEMEYAYYAGILGRSTASLPISKVFTGDIPAQGDETDTLTWTFNDGGFPTNLIVTEKSQWGEMETDRFSFRW